MLLKRALAGIAFALLPFTTTFALPMAPFQLQEGKPWVQSTYQGFSFFAPIALQKLEVPLPEEQKALFHTLEAYMGQADDYAVYCMFMHAKNPTVNLQGSMQGAIQNAVTQLQGTDLQIDYLEQNNSKNTLLATATFTRGTEKMMVKGYGYTDMKGKAYVFTAFGSANLKTDNIFTRMLTSIKVQ